MSEQRLKVTVKTKNVNSKLLFKNINDAVRKISDECIVPTVTLFAYEYEYGQLSMFLNTFMAVLKEKEVVRHYDVICDVRNNPQIQTRAGVIKALIKYKQKNCLNVTEIDYTFSIK